MRFLYVAIVCSAFLVGDQFVVRLSAEEPPANGDWAHMAAIAPKGYACGLTSEAPAIDGRLDEAAWQAAPWTDEFVDIEGDKKPKPRFRTRAKMLWDQEHFYIAAEMIEPHVWGTLTAHDSVIFHDNDFEVFIDPNGDNHEYYELELNALNTTWDLFLPRPYKDQGSADNSWEIPGLQSAVNVRGTLNDPSDEDEAWTVEIAIPWKVLGEHAHTAAPPNPGDRWRVNFSRVEWRHEIVDGQYRKVKDSREDNWVWSPQGIIDMHRPERWGFVQFVDAAPGEKDLVADPSLPARDRLMDIYHRQRTFHARNGRWASSFKELNFNPPDDFQIELRGGGETDAFLATLASQAADGSKRYWHVRHDSLLWESSADGEAEWPRVASVDNSVEWALGKAGDNRRELQKALDEAAEGQREALEFLIANMPDRDLQSLSADFLLENVRLAFEAWEAAPWKDQLPKDVFLNDVLPYASINERRDNWRREFREKCLPLIEGATTPAQASAILNQKIFKLFGVRYSTQRRKADQSPLESIHSGLASCTGLSVLLIDACRAVGVPARFVGTPLWADKSGNHSWVEVWDQGWHFTGAAEPSGDKLDDVWFLGRASAAKRDDPRHAIYATSFRRTRMAFPMVWDREAKYVSAVNVTDRYAAPRSETDEAEATTSNAAIGKLAEYLAKPADVRAAIAGEEFASVSLTQADAAKAKEMLWADHAAAIRSTRAAEMAAGELTSGDLKMPFTYRLFGDKPASGRSLYISLHGGGGAPKRVNDSQWENQKRLYQLEEGVYLTPRAPTDTWDLWHQGHIDGLFDRLIENLIVFEDVDPNRVYLMGYSAGGDGVYQLAPRMADRFAAAAMMAGHPNETSPLGLRNLPFAIHVGALDASYDRNKVAAAFGEQLAKLQSDDPGGYVHSVTIHKDKGHWMDGEDAAAIPWMAKYERSAIPTRIVWKQDDVKGSRFYWLAGDGAAFGDRAEIIAMRDGQHFDIATKDIDRLTFRLNDDMADLDQDIKIVSGAASLFEGRLNRTIAALAKTLAERGDPKAIFSAEVTVDLNRKE